jgi:hypothetical protein
MSNVYEIREPSGRVVAEAMSIQGANMAKRTLEKETGVKLTVYAPALGTYRRALESLR